MNTFVLIKAEEFENSINKLPKGNYLQTVEMAELKRSRGHDIFYTGVKDQNGNLILVAFVSRIKLHFGFIFEIDGFEAFEQDRDTCAFYFKEIKQWIKKNKGLALTISPNIAYNYYDDFGKKLQQTNDYWTTLFQEFGFTHQRFSTGYSTDGNPRWVYKKNLENISVNQLRESYGKNAKYSLTKAEKFGIVVKELKYEELPEFKQITEKTSCRKGFKDKSLDYYQKVYKNYGDKAKFLLAEINLKEYQSSLKQQEYQILKHLSDVECCLEQNPLSRKKNNQKRELISELIKINERVMTAKKWFAENGEIAQLACGLFLVSQHEIVYLFSGTEEKYKNLYASFLLQDKMLYKAIELQIPVYNFYGIAGHFDQSDSIMKFKRSFNGYVEEKIGTFVFITNKPNYYLYSILKKTKKKVFTLLNKVNIA